MTKNEWNALSPQERKKLVIELDSTMRDPRWSQLLEDMSRPFEALSAVQRNLVREMVQ